MEQRRTRPRGAARPACRITVWSMDSNRWNRIEELFQTALAADPADRSSMLQHWRTHDPLLTGEVERLLEAHDRAPSFLERPAFTFQRTPESLVAGERIGNYHLIRLLAVGGMGAVYEAEQHKPRRRVALKMLPFEAADERSYRRFEREIEVLGRLDHPNIARIYEAGLAGDCSLGQPYFVMELVDGRRITDHADAAGLDVHRRIELLLAVCEAVQYAHQRGIIHRDLKPANILVGSDGRPRLLDFGLARVLHSDAPAVTLCTRTGQLMGTLAYMSPEQLTGDLGGIDEQTDVYALGAILFELLSGKLPYDVAEKPAPAAISILTSTEPLPLDQVVPCIGEDLAAIASTALARDRNRRYASVQDFAADLQRLLRGEPVTARLRAARSGRSRLARWPHTLLLMVGAVILSATAAWSWMHRPRTSANSVGVAVQTLSFEEATDWLANQAVAVVQQSRTNAADGRAIWVDDVRAPAAASSLRNFCLMVEAVPEALDVGGLIVAYDHLVNRLRIDELVSDPVERPGPAIPSQDTGHPSAPLKPAADTPQLMVKLCYAIKRAIAHGGAFGGNAESLHRAMMSVPRNLDNGLVRADDGDPRPASSFARGARLKGDVLFSSLLFWEAARKLEVLYDVEGPPDRSRFWQDQAQSVGEGLESLWDEQQGWYLAASQQCRQPDVWGTAYAAYIGLTDPSRTARISRQLAETYSQWSYRGQVRHLLGDAVWESALAPPGTGDNGGYWAMPVGWVYYALRQSDQALAERLIIDLATDLRSRGAIPQWVTQADFSGQACAASLTGPVTGLRRMRVLPKPKPGTVTIIPASAAVAETTESGLQGEFWDIAAHPVTRITGSGGLEEFIRSNPPTATFHVSTVDYPRGITVKDPAYCLGRNTKTLPGSGVLSALLGPDAATLSDPAAGARNVQHLALRFSGCIELSAGRHRLDLGSDDGAAVRIAGLDAAGCEQPRIYVTDDHWTTTFVDVEADGLYPLEIIFYELTFAAGIELFVDGVVAPPEKLRSRLSAGTP